MIKKRKICVVSSSRADYNHLFLLIKTLKNKKHINFKLIVTGMHLLKKYGNTYKEIIKDGFKIDGYIKNKGLDSSNNNSLKIISDQFSNAGVILDKINPDIVVVLGDRYDILPIVIACHIKNIPVAHFHGGEVTHGAIDDAIRHSITKFSDIHFVSNNDFKDRVKQLGENPKNIYNIGSLGVLAIKSTKKIRKIDILKKYNIKGDYILVALHPETINNNNSLIIKALFKVMTKHKKSHIVFTCPNSDPGNDEIIENINKFLKLHPDKSSYITSAGREDFINLIRHAKFLIGNSSSCVIEAPAIGTKSILIGKRQSGRPLASTVIKANTSYTSINNEVNRILKKSYTTEKKNKLFYKPQNPLTKILKILSSTPLENIKLKKFYDQK